MALIWASPPRRINIKQLIAALSEITQIAATPLLIDPSGRIDVFFEYSAEFDASIIDCKKIVVETFIMKKRSVADTLEMLRLVLVNCIRYGKTLVIGMSNSAMAFENTFNSPDHFPIEVFQNSGKPVLQKCILDKLIRAHDMTNGVLIPKIGFQVVITSQLGFDSYNESLASALPTELISPVEIDPVQDENGYHHRAEQYGR